MKTLLISDTHCKHKEMDIDLSVDLIVHAGDCTSSYNPKNNQVEFIDFIEWYRDLPIKHKVLIAGNHDYSLLKKYNKDMCKEFGIDYLEDEYIEIEGNLIFGSPWSPTYGNWYFQRSREKLGTFWDMVLIEGIDLLVTHAPAKNVLDLSRSPVGSLELSGCSGLRKAVRKYKPRHHVAGHIHNNTDIVNFGSRGIGDTMFYNVSAVKDGDFDKPPVNNKGLIIEL